MSTKALEALALYDAWQATPPDREWEKIGPKQRAYLAFVKAKDAALAEHAENEDRAVRARVRHAKIENRAREIYETWSDRAGYVPWVEHGNSTMQNKARHLAQVGMP